MPHPWAAEPCLAGSSPLSRSISRRDGKSLPYELQQEPQLERMSVDVRMPIGSAPDGRLVGTALPQVQEVQRAVAHLWHHLPRTDEVARASDQCRHGAADVTACSLARWSFRGAGTAGSSLGSQQIHGEGLRSRNLPLNRIIVPGAAAPTTWQDTRCSLRCSRRLCVQHRTLYARGPRQPHRFVLGGFS